jgi:ATP-dependent Clp protease ATP-binding subunit ClpA
VSPAVKQKLATDGFDPLFGARPLKREVELRIENVLAQKLISGEFFKGDTVRVNLIDGKIVFQRAATELAPQRVDSVPSPGNAQPD